MNKPTQFGHGLTMALMWLGVVAAAWTALLGIWVTASGDDRNGTVAMLGTSVLAVVYIALALGAATVIRAGRLYLLMSLAIVSALAGFMFFFSLIAAESLHRGRDEVLVIALGTTATTLAVVLVHAGMFARLETKSILLRVAKWIVVATTATAGLAVTCLPWLEVLDRSGSMASFFLLIIVLQVAIALSLLGTFTVPLLIRMSARRASAVSESLARRAITMTCPRCAVEQEFSTGPCWCKSCRFTMMIDVEEPRCECGYLLYQLQGDTCPECGRILTKPQAPSAATSSQLG